VVGGIPTGFYTSRVMPFLTISSTNSEVSGWVFLISPKVYIIDWISCWYFCVDEAYTNDSIPVSNPPADLSGIEQKGGNLGSFLRVSHYSQVFEGEKKEVLHGTE